MVTSIGLLIDASYSIESSLGSLKDAIRDFIKEQKQANPNVYCCLAQYNRTFHVIQEGNILEFDEQSCAEQYRLGAGSSAYQAILEMIKHMEEKGKQAELINAGRTIVIILTDGDDQTYEVGLSSAESMSPERRMNRLAATTDRKLKEGWELFMCSSFRITPPALKKLGFNEKNSFLVRPGKGAEAIGRASSCLSGLSTKR